MCKRCDQAVRKICFFTGSRADKSPMSRLIELLDKNAFVIETEGLYGNEAHVLSELSSIQPSMAVCLGDRVETLLACTLAASMAIPIAHIHGGDCTLGSTDDCMRHTITKLAYWHFPACELHAQRIMQMGESPDKVFVCGAVGIDQLVMPRMSREEIEAELGIKLKSPVALVCYHAETLSDRKIEMQISEIQLRMEQNTGSVIICGSNADIGGKEINTAQYLWANQILHRQNSVYRESFGQKLWLSLMHESDMLIGNSSSFVFEGLTLGKKVIIVGDRQKGRYEDALKMFAKERYPFGEPGTVSQKIAEKLMSIEIPEKPRKVFCER